MVGRTTEGAGRTRRVIVSNTGPLLHLREIAALPLIGSLGEVLIPPAVNEEAAVHDDQWTQARPFWIRVFALENPYLARAMSFVETGALHLGESEAIALSLQMGADWFLTDDAAARRFGNALGLEVHGSLGVVLAALGDGTCSPEDAENALSRLRCSSLHLTDEVWERARMALNRLVART